MAVPLQIKLRADGSEFQRDVTRTISSVRNSIMGFMSLGVATSMLRMLADEVGRIKDMAEQIGISTGAFQEIDYAMKRAGLSGESLVSIFSRMANLRQAALDGEMKSAEAFYKLGISMGEVKSMNAEELFMRIARAITEINDPMMKAAVATDLFGRGASRIVEVLADLEKTRAAARQKGLIFGDDEIERIDEVSKKLDDIWRKAKVLGAKGLVNLVTGLTRPGEALPKTEKQIFEEAAKSGNIVDATIGMAFRRVRQLYEEVMPDWIAKNPLLAGPIPQFRGFERLFGITDAEKRVMQEAAEIKRVADEQRKAELQAAAEEGWHSTLEDYERALAAAKKPAAERIGGMERLPHTDLTEFQRIGAYAPRDVVQVELRNNMRQLVATNQQILQILRQLGSPAWSMF